MPKFLKQYILHPRSVGAIKASGTELTNKMLEDIDFDKAKVIVEYGPGTGAFSKEIIKRKKDDTLFIMIEINKEFYKILNNDLDFKKNVLLLNDSAENIDKILKDNKVNNIDYIVSGLPFTSLPKKTNNAILSETKKVLGKGKFITFQYSKVKEKLFLEYFNIDKIIKASKNIPPAYVYILKNKSN